MNRSPWYTRAATLVAACMLLGGCVTLGPPAPPPASPAAESQYESAQALLDAGNYRGAIDAFLAAAQADPKINDRARLGAAAGYRALGQFERTAALLQQVNPARLGAGDEALYRVLSASVALNSGYPDAALQQLARLPHTPPSEVQLLALDVESRAQLARGDRLAAARALAKRVPLLPQVAQAAAQHGVIALLAGISSQELTPTFATLADNDPLKPYVRQALNQSGIGLAQALPQLGEPVGTRIDAGAPQGYAMPTHVGLLLPASGPVAVAAQAVRDGFFAAYFHGALPAEQRPAIKVYDTAGTPAGALLAYQQAVAGGATLIVGPLSREAVAALFTQASLPVPVLALNHPQGDVPMPVGSAEFALLPETEGAQLATYMIGQGLHAAIVFRGDDETASRTFDAFRIQFASLGGQIANHIVLPGNTVNYADPIKAALAGSGSETGIVALLRPTQGRLLLPQLRLARSTLPVFATSMIYSGFSNATADGDLDGVVFCDEPWLYDAQAGLPDRASLAAKLDSASGPAARLFAFGMDVYALMPYLGWLRSHPGSYLPGATGQLTMNGAGVVQRVPIWLRFERGLASPIGAGLQTQPAPAKATNVP